LASVDNSSGCGTTAAPMVPPGGTASPTVALPGITNPTPRPTPTTAISTPQPVATAMPTQPVSAKDSIILLIGSEHMNFEYLEEKRWWRN
jgi:hypothetical protein